MTPFGIYSPTSSLLVLVLQSLFVLHVINIPFEYFTTPAFYCTILVLPLPHLFPRLYTCLKTLEPLTHSIINDRWSAWNSNCFSLHECCQTPVFLEFSVSDFQLPQYCVLVAVMPGIIILVFCSGFIESVNNVFANQATNRSHHNHTDTVLCIVCAWSILHNLFQWN